MPRKFIDENRARLESLGVHSAKITGEIQRLWTERAERRRARFNKSRVVDQVTGLRVTQARPTKPHRAHSHTLAAARAQVEEKSDADATHELQSRVVDQVTGLRVTQARPTKPHRAHSHTLTAARAQVEEKSDADATHELRRKKKKEKSKEEGGEGNDHRSKFRILTKLEAPSSEMFFLYGIKFESFFSLPHRT